MNRRLRLLIAALVAAVLFLSAAIISFRFSGSQTDTPQDDAPEEEISSGVELFFENGLWGARKASGRVMIEPKWYYLRKMSDTVLIARRNDGKIDRFGLIGISGEQLMPFLYRDFTYAGSSDPELWIAPFEENGSVFYHLYREDGTRWSDIAWDDCRYEDGILYAASGSDTWQGVLEKNGIRWIKWHTEYPVGLHRLVMDFDEAALKQLPPAETLSRLGETAADYLLYLFVTKKPPDQESRTDYSYPASRLLSARISRIRQRETDGLPSYFVQMQVRYQRQENGKNEFVDTAMELILTRDSAGAFTIGGFNDLQKNAAGGDLIN